MSSYVPTELRRLVIARSDRLCEYCLIHEDDTFLGCQVEHIISEKHNGPTDAQNLAYACTFCNRYKGSDIGSIVWSTQQFCRFFNPRTDIWYEHFRLEEDFIQPLTHIGEVTATILQFNNPERLLERKLLRHAGRYPSPEALLRIG